MEPVQFNEIVEWTHAQPDGTGLNPSIGAISTDTRTIEAGDCYLALVGERFDGHDFVADAVAKGAAALVLKRGTPLPNDVPGWVPIAWVDDTLRAFQGIANGYRRRFRIPVVAVTGSNGKTTTKNMTAAVLSSRWSVLATEKNLNNEIGLPKTLLGLERGHGAAVVELGMRALGEIARLAETAEPTVGVVTNVAMVHLENLGQIENVAAAKAELIEALPSDGVAVLNRDDPRTYAMRTRTSAPFTTFGFSADSHVRAVDVMLQGEEGTRFVLLIGDKKKAVRLNVLGRHHVVNALAAAAVGAQLGLTIDEIVSGLEKAETDEMRMQMVPLGSGVRLVDDAYNASPLSTEAALKTLAELSGERKVAVLGDMLELGKIAEEAHRRIGQQAHRFGMDLVAAVGSMAEQVKEGAVEAGMDPKAVLTFADSQQCAHSVSEWSKPGDLILLKGSRGIRLERVSDALKHAFGEKREREL